MTSFSHADALQALIDGDHAGAGTIISGLLSKDGNDHQAWSLKGRLAGLQGRFDDEMVFITKAVDLNPRDANYLTQLGNCHARRQSQAEAFACIDRALACERISDVALDGLSVIYTRFGFHAEAAEVLTRAVAAGTRNPAIHFNLGTRLKFCGDFAGARAAYERAIALAPDFAKAHAALSSLGGITADDNHVDRLFALIERTPDPTEKLHLSHAAARECETLGDYERAFSCLHGAKTAFRAGLKDTSRQEARLFEAIKAAFTQPRTVKGYSDAAPLFITGMPRTGTTVLDRVVSNHSAITSIGETQHFSTLMKQRTASFSRHVVDEFTVTRLGGADDLSDIGEAYMKLCLGMSGERRFVDKFHLNILVAGFIARALPGARILCLVRDPLDTVVSNYRQLFELGSPIYHYTLDLAASARFYIGFRQLADLWTRHFPEQFRIVRYEALVSNPEPEIRKVLDFCGLEWEDRCLHIETNESAVATASAVQVRQPINARSIGNWRRYEAHLGEAQAILSAAGLIN